MSVLTGVLSFALLFAVVWLVAQFAFGWAIRQAQIAGVALSTTSVAVVYAVMIEGGLSETPMGRMILAACFITDLGTVFGLGKLFANFNMWLLVFAVVTLIILLMPKWTQSVIEQLGATRVRAGSEIHFLRSVFSRRFGHHSQGDEPPSFVFFGVPSAGCS